MANLLRTKLRDSASMFAALGDETRLEIISSLCEHGPQSITKLADGKKITRQGITKHLEALNKAGLAQYQQVGREKIWDLNNKRLQVAKDYLDLVSRRWDVALDKLKNLVE